MKNESFAETLKKALDNYDHKEIVFDEYILGIYESVLYSFETYGDFLNCIPLGDREKIIYNKILPWVSSYASNSLLKQINRLSPITKEAVKEIDKNIGIIDRFENMIQENFSPIAETINLNNEFNIPNDPQSVKNIEVVKVLLKTTNILKDDLISKDFKIFPKYKYRAYDRISKKGLEVILNNLVTTYRIKGASVDKKDLKDNIITL